MNWKMRTVVSCLTVFALVLCSALVVDAAEVGRAVSALGDLNLDLFDGDVDGDTFPSNDADGNGINETGASTFDMFGPGQRGLVILGDPTGDPYAFQMQDDSLSVFPGDMDGIIKGGDPVNGTPLDDAPFFGVSDTQNPDVCGAGIHSCSGVAQQASWDFDVSAASGALSLSIDFAAMGNFEDDVLNFPNESEDVFTVEISFGGAFTPLFTSSVDESLDPDYVLESGTIVNLTDPISINGTQLNNDFQTITVAIPGSGDNLTVRLTADSDGGAEAFAIRNILVEDGGAAGVAGDYNEDGVVNAADYTVWLDNLGGTSLPNEGASTGTVDSADYDFWKSRFGATTGVGTGSSSIPEPCSALLVLLAALQIGAIRRR